MQNQATHPLLAYFLAMAILPVVGVWLSTILDIAPLMHRRYIIGSHIALFLFGGTCLARLPRVPLRVAVGVLSIASMTWTHGQWNTWSHGEWMGWQRDEDWRSALEVLDAHRGPEDLVALAPMLIETQSIESISAHSPDYLTFALRCIYPKSGGLAPLFDDATLVLSNDIDAWKGPLSALPRHKIAWIVVRKSRDELERERVNRETLGFGWREVDAEILGDFGSVQIRRLVVINE